MWGFDSYDDDNDLLLFERYSQRHISVGAASGPPLANLVLWLKADAITGLNDGDPITTWLDSSGAGNNASQATAANKPIYKTGIINGRPVARFDAVNDGMVTANAAFSVNPISVFVVYAGNSNVASRRAVQGDVPAQDWLIGPYTNSYQVFNGVFITDGAVSAGVFKLSTYIHTGAAASFWLNGVLIGSNAQPRAPNRINLGASGTTPEVLDGDIAEVLGYNVDMTSQRATVEAYLNSKYALF